MTGRTRSRRRAKGADGERHCHNSETWLHHVSEPSRRPFLVVTSLAHIFDGFISAHCSESFDMVERMGKLQQSKRAFDIYQWPQFSANSVTGVVKLNFERLSVTSEASSIFGG